MRTIALRFSDAFAPKAGTIYEHLKLIKKYGYVWYGKKGGKISPIVVKDICKTFPIKALFIKTSSAERYWITIEEIQYSKPDIFPSYYKDELSSMKTFLKITNIEVAPPDVLKNCFLTNGKCLDEILKKTMAFIFQKKETMKDFLF